MSLDFPAPGEELEWLPARADWQTALAGARGLGIAEALGVYRDLARSRMDFARTVKLDRTVQRLLDGAGGSDWRGWSRCRLALLGSSTLTHLIAGIRVAGLRRGMLIEVYESPYGGYWQELVDSSSGLHRFQPETVLFALDARHLAGYGQRDAMEQGAGPADRALATMHDCWRRAREAFGCSVVQQTALPVFAPLLGNQEYRLAESPLSSIETINRELRVRAGADGVALLALDAFARQDGLRQWHDEGLWHRAKQEVHPRMSPMYGEQVARVLGALAGRSSKCLVLDLDHTLWGGGIGDDGLEGIELGQGSAAGEAYLAFQDYVRGLKERGVILAVCSKNDEANALLPFERHPDMALRREDIACFVANWQDKATNLRRIARTLNIGLDSLVFVDDNAAERGLVRRELPMVEVPEMPEDPAEYVRVLAGAGYFEGICVTEEDRSRAGLYAAVAAKEGGPGWAGGDGSRTTDLASYLAGLGMELTWRPFDLQGRSRIVQLINKTNQFNLTTKRCVESEIERVISRRDGLGLQFRLKDMYGDNGMIGVLHCVWAGEAGWPDLAEGDLAIERWLMSCRVLGRQVEEAMMNVLAEQARLRRFRRIVGRYIPTAKNDMVREHYRRMGFELVETAADGSTRWAMEVQDYRPFATQIACVEVGLVSV